MSTEKKKLWVTTNWGKRFSHCIDCGRILVPLKDEDDYFACVGISQWLVYCKKCKKLFWDNCMYNSVQELPTKEYDLFEIIDSPSQQVEKQVTSENSPVPLIGKEERIHVIKPAQISAVEELQRRLKRCEGITGEFTSGLRAGLKIAISEIQKGVGKQVKDELPVAGCKGNPSKGVVRPVDVTLPAQKPEQEVKE